MWTKDSLLDLTHTKLRDYKFILVSNREPYVHQRTPNGIEVEQPASGLTVALDPIMRACGGTWVANGSGSADRETVDEKDRIGVPPEDPHYTLRRVWLTQLQEERYYYGLANRALWPLCHIGLHAPSSALKTGRLTVRSTTCSRAPSWKKSARSPPSYSFRTFTSHCCRAC